MFNPKYTINGKLLKNCKQIAVLIERLNAKVVPTPLFLELEREAREVSTFTSTTIEGNPLPITDVRRLLKQKPENLRESEQEVVNYNESLSVLYKHMSEEHPFDLKLVLNIHKKVTHKLLLPSQSGKLRTEPVFVNDPVKRETIYWPPDHSDIPEFVADLLQFVSKNRYEIDPVLLAGIFHKQFVVLHPFPDGNGRTVRLLTHFLLANLGIKTFHLFSFERYYSYNVQKYFDAVGVRGNYYDIAKELDFTGWLEYFTDGILDELFRLEKELQRQISSLHPPLNEAQEQIISYLKTHGTITDAIYSSKTDRAKATRTIDFKKLLDFGLIERIGKGKATYYVLRKKKSL